MDLGVHLPVLTFNESEPETPSLIAYVEAARRLGFTAVSVNDHLQHRRPWLDAPTALASVVSATGDMTLATTIALAVVRGPIPLAKSLGAIDLLSGGRLVVGVGPGSHAPDYEAAGLAWDERWPRFEESIGALRALWRPDGEPFEGTFYSTRGIRLEPAPAQDGGPPIWVGSWGSRRRAPTGGPARGRLDRLRLQHHARGVRGVMGSAARAASARTARIPRRSRTRSPR